MKPNFALSLSFEGIRLLHRVSGGWRVIGEAAVDADDLSGELAVLRKTAAALEPGGVRTKLLIPNDQIKYMTISTPDHSDAERRAAARAALENATPYAVDDLAFDISSDGTQTHIAAVARETLAEAEAFANEHRFHPVSFVAIPLPHTFRAEPFFGPSDAAETILDAGDAVDPDDESVVVLDDLTSVEAAKARPEQAILPLPKQPDDPAITATVEMPAVKETATTGSPPLPVALPDPASTKDEADRPAETELATASAQEKSTDTVIAVQDTTHLTAKEMPQEDRGPENVTPREDPQSDLFQENAPTEGESAAQNAQAEDRLAKDSVREDKDIAPEGGASGETAPDALAGQSPAQNDTDAKAAKKPDLPPKTIIAAVSPSGKDTGRTPAPAAPVATAFTSRRTTPAPTVGGASRTTPSAATVSAPALQTTGSAAPVPDSSSLRASTPDAFVSAAQVKPSKLAFLSRRKPRKIEPLPPTAAIVTDTGIKVPQTSSEAEKMTVFGARKSTGIGGKPRFLGLLLTAALLVFLAGVAAWASVFMDDRVSLSRIFGTRDTTAIASAPAQAPDQGSASRAAAQTGMTGVDPNSGEQTVVAALDPTLSDEDGAVLDALRVPERAQPRDATQQELEAKYATSGIWALAPQTPAAPAMITLDDLYLTSIDPISTASDAIALPTLASYGGDTFDFNPASPAAAGTTFALDARGLVAPSPQGTLNPDGVLVFAGQPPALPPASPTRADPAPVSETESIALTGFRPKPRPTGLVESNERSQLSGLTRAELGRIRPQLRQPSIQQAAEAVPAPEVAAAAASAAASLAAVSSPVVAATVPPQTIVNATAFAVKASPRPDTRPKNFARIVKRAEQTAPEPVQVASAASVAPRVVKPSAPSKTSVAKQATVKNAIKLRDINLIGVYGKPSSRRALIRLSNGRYQKVAVGDKLDGGRVSAIGDAELRYTKRGRDVVLKMPHG